MKNFVFLMIGIIIGINIGGMCVFYGASESKQRYDDAVREFVSTIDEDYLMDVLVETDAWSNLNEYVDLSNE